MKIMLYSGIIAESLRTGVPGVEVFEVYPPLDITNEDVFLTQLDSLIAAGTDPKVVLDLTRVDLKKDVIAVLLHAMRDLHSRRQAVFHLVPNEKGLRVMHLTHLDQYPAIGRVFRTVHGAYAAFGQTEETQTAQGQ